MNYIQWFETIKNYTDNKSTLEYPNVSYIEENAEIYYASKPVPPIATYITTGNSQQITLVSKQEYLDYAKILDTDELLPITGTGVLNYTFSSSGEHQVELKFKDDSSTLEQAFYVCSALLSVSDNIFQNCSLATSFEDTFGYCTKLTGISSNLFSNCPSVNTFKNTFRYCVKLPNIPDKLFASNKKVTDFSNTFSSCSGITGNVPTDDDGTPIYNRSGSGKNGYEIVTVYYDCFLMCNGLSDVESIPEDWR